MDLTRRNHIDLDSEDEPVGECKHPGSISSGGMWPCIAVGVFDKKKKQVYMIHEDNAEHNQRIPGFCDKVLKKSKPEDLKVWVAGGSKYGEDEDENVDESQVERDRAFVESTINERFQGSEISIEWNDKDLGCELTINTDGQGHVDYLKQDSQDDDFDNDLSQESFEDFDY